MDGWIGGWMEEYNLLERKKSYIAQSSGTILSFQLDYYLLSRYELNFIATIYVTVACIQNIGNVTVSACLDSFFPNNNIHRKL